jgi:hypothetical protein
MQRTLRARQRLQALETRFLVVFVGSIFGFLCWTRLEDVGVKFEEHHVFGKENKIGTSVSQFRSELPVSSPQIEDGSPQNRSDTRDEFGLGERSWMVDYRVVLGRLIVSSSEGAYHCKELVILCLRSIN